jgi:ADP-ribose pyrophosphatase YjhB (NUDIX family)
MGDSRFESKIPPGDSIERQVCRDCGFINYRNPRIICGVVPTWGDSILLCTRAIAPREGYWTVPSGFMELGETPQEGAAREAHEEAFAQVDVGPLIGVYTVTHIGQVQMFYRGTLRSDDVKPGPESHEVRLTPWKEIPWDDLAFPTIRWALQDFHDSREHDSPVPVARSTDGRRL